MAADQRGNPARLSPGEYVTLVVVLAAALVGTVMFVTWLAETRGLLAPAGARRENHPSYGVPDADAGDD